MLDVGGGMLGNVKFIPIIDMKIVIRQVSYDTCDDIPTCHDVIYNVCVLVWFPLASLCATQVPVSNGWMQCVELGFAPFDFSVHVFDCVAILSPC